MTQPGRILPTELGWRQAPTPGQLQKGRERLSQAGVGAGAGLMVAFEFLLFFPHNKELTESLSCIVSLSPNGHTLWSFFIVEMMFLTLGRKKIINFEKDKKENKKKSSFRNKYVCVCVCLCIYVCVYIYTHVCTFGEICMWMVY